MMNRVQDPNQSQQPDSSSDVRNRNRIKLEMEVKQEPWESEVRTHNTLSLYLGVVLHCLHECSAIQFSNKSIFHGVKFLVKGEPLFFFCHMVKPRQHEYSVIYCMV
jgi:hypothetical protein